MDVRGKIMSLPSKAIFYKNNKEVYHEFVNCGWVLNDNSIIRVFKEMSYPEEWDEVYLYGDIYTKENVEALIEIDKVLKDFWRNKFNNCNEKNVDFKLNIHAIRKIFPKLISKEIVSVQPMSVFENLKYEGE
jgi:hypothetical protein